MFSAKSRLISSTPFPWVSLQITGKASHSHVGHNHRLFLSNLMVNVYLEFTPPDHLSYGISIFSLCKCVCVCVCTHTYVSKALEDLHQTAEAKPTLPLHMHSRATMNVCTCPFRPHVWDRRSALLAYGRLCEERLGVA